MCKYLCLKPYATHAVCAMMLQCRRPICLRMEKNTVRVTLIDMAFVMKQSVTLPPCGGLCCHFDLILCICSILHTQTTPLITPLCRMLICQTLSPNAAAAAASSACSTSYASHASDMSPPGSLQQRASQGLGADMATGRTLACCAVPNLTTALR